MRFTFFRLAATALFVAGTFRCTAAQVRAEPAPSPSASPLPEIGRVSTSDRRLEPVGETSRPTFVIERRQIEDEGARTLADALRDVPGVQLFEYGPFGALVDYGIRGALNTRTLILVDGQPIADPTSGTVNLAQVSTLGVARIEVVESASSSLYGTSASGGVINVVTSVPRATYLEGSLASYADRDLRVESGNGRFGASVERHVATNGFAYPALNYGPPGCTTISQSSCRFPAAVRLNDYGDQSVGRLSADLPVGSGISVRARADTTSLAIGVPSRLDFATPNTTDRAVNDTALVEIERATKNGTLSLDLSGATERATYADPSFGAYDTYWGRSQLSVKDALNGRRGDLVAGIDLSRSSGNFAFPASATTPASSVGAAQSEAAAYVQLGARPFAGSRVTGGLRAERDSPAGSVLAPSFGAVFALAQKLRLAGNVSESFTVPTLQDLYYPGAANPNLQPEKSQDADVTLAYDARGATVSAGWFTRNGANFIVLNPATFLPYNAQHAAVAGLVLTGRAKLAAGLVADVSYTDLYRALDLGSRARLPRTPVGQATAGITKPFGASRTSFGVRFGVVGSDGDDAANVPPPLIGRYDSYSSLDAFVRFRVRPDAVLSVRGFDLGNDREAPIFGYPNVGRRFSLELATR